MSMRRLPARDTRLLRAGRIVPSYEAALSLLIHAAISAGARSVRAIASPAALRICVVDDAARVWDPTSPLASLADVATVEIFSSMRGVRIAKLVRAGILLDDGALGPDRVHPELKGGDGTVVDVWELFHALPVRRRAELAKDSELVLGALRRCVIAISFAFPNVSLRLEAANGTAMFVSIPAPHVNMRMLTVAFGAAPEEAAWCFVDATGSSLTVEGFVAKMGLVRNPEAQVISVNGFPLEEGGWMHRVVRRVWRSYARMQTGGMDVSRRNPAFALTCTCESRNVDVVAGEHGASVSFVEAKAVESCLVVAILDALRGTRSVARGTKALLHADVAISGTRDYSRFSSRQGHIRFRVQKRARVAIANQDFGEAMLRNTIAVPESSWSNTLGTRCLARPHSVGTSPPRVPATPVENSLTGRPRAVSARIGVRRPKSTEQVTAAFKSALPVWTNPCFPSHGQRLRRVADSVPRKGEGSASVDMREVRISREAIPALRVVGQSDLKFIIVVDDGGAMYAVDQHAASERALYESLQKRLIPHSVTSVALNPYVRVQLTVSQNAALGRFKSELASWGWCLTTERYGRNSMFVEMTGVPRIDMLDITVNSENQLRRYLDSLVSGAISTAVPRPILDAVATAACHSAVRFGDELSREQCQAVIQSLADCDCPFICAHGRPSIVPLVLLKDSEPVHVLNQTENDAILKPSP